MWISYFSTETYIAMISGTLRIVSRLRFFLAYTVYRCRLIESQHEITNNVVCATSKRSDQPAHTRSLIRAFASRLNIL